MKKITLLSYSMIVLMVLAIIFVEISIVLMDDSSLQFLSNYYLSIGHVSKSTAAFEAYSFITEELPFFNFLFMMFISDYIALVRYPISKRKWANFPNLLAYLRLSLVIDWTLIFCLFDGVFLLSYFRILGRLSILDKILLFVSVLLLMVLIHLMFRTSIKGFRKKMQELKSTEDTSEIKDLEPFEGNGTWDFLKLMFWSTLILFLVLVGPISIKINHAFQELEFPQTMIATKDNGASICALNYNGSIDCFIPSKTDYTIKTFHFTIDPMLFDPQATYQVQIHYLSNTFQTVSIDVTDSLDSSSYTVTLSDLNVTNNFYMYILKGDEHISPRDYRILFSEI